MSNRVWMRKSIISCCLIFLALGCETNLQNIGGDEQSSKKAKAENKDEIVVEIDDSGKVLTPTAPVAPGPSSVSVPPGPTPLGNGTGGGSQGALQPIDTGNEDDGEEEIPTAVCGNGKQEAYAGDYNCPFDMYGVTITDMSGTSKLVGFFFDRDGQGGPIGTINDYHDVTDVDFSPQGVLYGVGRDGSNNWSLLVIDCKTAQVTWGGSLGIGSSPTVSDISFDSFGRLWAYVDYGSSQQVGLINPDTGIFYALANPTGLTDSGNGLGSAPFPSDGLYDAGNAFLSSIDRAIGTGGAGTHVYALNFTAPATNAPKINGLDVDPLTELFYASIDNSGNNYLGILDLNSGNVGFIVNPPYDAPYGLQGIAVNRNYEECDPLSGDPALPSGTSCTDECFFVESNCADGIDNDQDGVADCADSDCNGQSCNDGNGCTDDDTCNEGTCSGTTVTCEIENECLIGTCVPFVASPNSPAGNGQYHCNYSLDLNKETFGSCTPSDNCNGERNPDGTCPEDQVIDLCEVGKCVQETCPMNNTPPEIECEGLPKALVAVNEGGCLDTNPCTADGCDAEDGACEYGYLENVACDDGNDCTTRDVCQIVEIDEDIDDDTEPSVNSVCQGVAVGSCTDDDDCPSGSCIDGTCGCPTPSEHECFLYACSNGSCQAVFPYQPTPGVPCDIGAACVVNNHGTCDNTQPGQCNVTPQSSGTPCIASGCLQGTCNGAPIDGCPNAVPTNSLCQDSCLSVCVLQSCNIDGTCDTEIADGEVPCGSGSCAGFQTCENGVAIGGCDPTDEEACDD